jgi:hypothetical protein
VGISPHPTLSRCNRLIHPASSPAESRFKLWGIHKPANLFQNAHHSYHHVHLSFEQGIATIVSDCLQNSTQPAITTTTEQTTATSTTHSNPSGPREETAPEPCVIINVRFLAVSSTFLLTAPPPLATLLN